MIRQVTALTILLLFAAPALADTFTEDFESYNTVLDPTVNPDQDWYDYSEGAEIGNISFTDPILGSQSLKVNASTTTDASARYVDFTLESPAQLISLEFYVEGTPKITDGVGSQQVVTIESSAPVRKMVQFFIMCNDSTNISGCELRVRFETIDTTGQILINGSVNQTQFQIEVVPDWLTGNYNLFVDGVDDGVFPFLELPEDIGRLRIYQHRADIPINLSFDNFTVDGTVNGSASVVEGDAVNGLKNFAIDIRFSSAGSKFFLGFLLFIILMAAVIVPILTLGMDNSVLPAVGFFGVLVIIFLVFIEFWPDWVGIGLIILTAALIATTLRALVMGISDASSGAGLVAGSLGYFVIATSLLAFSGYATDTIEVPSAPVEQTADASGLLPADQGFLEQVTECIFTGGVFTFGLRGDCAQDTQTTTWKKITDALGWARAGLDFLFQLLTFQLPIPVIFNVMIVLPAAAALAYVAVATIRGFAT